MIDITVPASEDTSAETDNTKPSLPRGKQPRNWQDRSKYGPHQNKREKIRRLRQLGWSNPADPLDQHLPYPVKAEPTEEDMLAVRQLAADTKRMHW